MVGMICIISMTVVMVMTVMRNIDDTYDDVVDTADAEYEWGGHADDGTAVGYADVDDYAGDGDGNG